MPLKKKPSEREWCRVVLFLSVLILPFPAPVSPASQQEAAGESSWLPLWEKAKGLESQGAYLKAKEIYESLLQQEALGPRARSIQKEYEALKMKLLFSPLETPESFFHTVVRGDTLFELAKKYRTTGELLQRSNGLSGDRIYPGVKLKVTRTEFSLVIEKRRNRLVLFADGKPLKRYRVSTGINGSTPSGTFKIVNKLKDPTWFHAGAIVPPESPENILGSRWLGFDLAGYGIHGTTLPETIGTYSSRGCIRMFNPDVEEIYTLVPVGTRVLVKE